MPCHISSFCEAGAVYIGDRTHLPVTIPMSGGRTEVTESKDPPSSTGTFPWPRFFPPGLAMGFVPPRESGRPLILYFPFFVQPPLLLLSWLDSARAEFSLG